MPLTIRSWNRCSACWASNSQRASRVVPDPGRLVDPDPDAPRTPAPGAVPAAGLLPYNGDVSSSRPPLPRRSRLRILPFAAALALVAGTLASCSEPETISTYETARTDPRLAKLDPADLRQSLDHMFTAIVPAGEQAWFFKLVVPEKIADELRQPFKDFLATVKADETGALPSWNLPGGWQAGGAREMLDATISIPHTDGPLELTVSKLPLGDDWPAYMEQNVNRWLGQLQEDPRDKVEIESLVQTTPTAGGEATMFELVGKMARPAMGGGMPAGHPPVGAPPTSAAAQPATPSTQSADSTAKAPPASGFAFETPAGWTPGAPNPMRKASLVVEGGGEVAVNTFGASGQMADPRANAQRWAGQVGLTDLSEEALSKASQDVNIGGVAGKKFEFLSPDGVQPAQGILAAMIVRDGEAWFFKLSGPKATVESQREAFNKFLESVQFGATK